MVARFFLVLHLKYAVFRCFAVLNEIESDAADKVA